MLSPVHLPHAPGYSSSVLVTGIIESQSFNLLRQTYGKAVASYLLTATRRTHTPRSAVEVDGDGPWLRWQCPPTWREAFTEGAVAGFVPTTSPCREWVERVFDNSQDATPTRHPQGTFPSYARSVEDGSASPPSSSLQVRVMAAKEEPYASTHSSAAPACPVAAFHCSNGAVLYDVHVGADITSKGLAQSHGLMVNYR